jgi:hypothetical protein
MFNAWAGEWLKGRATTGPELRDMMTAEVESVLKQNGEEAIPALLSRCKTETVALADLESLTTAYQKAPVWKRTHPPYPAILPTLVGLLPNPDFPIRAQVLLGLQRLGPDARSAMLDLIPLLPADSINSVMTTLRAIDPEWERNPQVVGHFQQLLASEDHQKQWDYLRWLSEKSPTLVEELSRVDPKFHERVEAIVAAHTQQGGGSKAWDAQQVALRLLNRLGTPASTSLTWVIRNYATLSSPGAQKDALRLFSTPSAGALLLGALQSEDTQLSLAAANLLFVLRPKPPGTVDACIEALAGTKVDAATRTYLISILSDQGKEARPAISVLFAHSCNPGFAEQARQTLGRIDERWWTEPGLVQVILPLLRSKDKPRVLLACERVAMLGKQGREALPELKRLEMDADFQVSGQATFARQSIERAIAMPQP